MVRRQRQLNSTFYHGTWVELLEHVNDEIKGKTIQQAQKVLCGGGERTGGAYSQVLTVFV